MPFPALPFDTAATAPLTGRGAVGGLPTVSGTGTRTEQGQAFAAVSGGTAGIVDGPETEIPQAPAKLAPDFAALVFPQPVHAAATAPDNVQPEDAEPDGAQTTKPSTAAPADLMIDETLGVLPDWLQAALATAPNVASTEHRAPSSAAEDPVLSGQQTLKAQTLKTTSSANVALQADAPAQPVAPPPAAAPTPRPAGTALPEKLAPATAVLTELPSNSIGRVPTTKPPEMNFEPVPHGDLKGTVSTEVVAVPAPAPEARAAKAVPAAHFTPESTTGRAPMVARDPVAIPIPLPVSEAPQPNPALPASARTPPPAPALERTVSAASIRQPVGKATPEAYTGPAPVAERNAPLTTVFAGKAPTASRVSPAGEVSMMPPVAARPGQAQTVEPPAPNTPSVRGTRPQTSTGGPKALPTSPDQGIVSNALRAETTTPTPVRADSSPPEESHAKAALPAANLIERPLPSDTVSVQRLEIASSQTVVRDGPLVEPTQTREPVSLAQLQTNVSQRLLALVPASAGPEAGGHDPTQARTAEIELAPAELGKLKLTLQTTERGLHLVVAVERPEMIEAVRRHLETLHRALLSEGVTLDGLDIGAGTERRGESRGEHEEGPPLTGDNGPPDPDIDTRPPRSHPVPLGHLDLSL